MKKIDLSGTWLLYMDETKADKLPEAFNESIILPNTTSAARKGKKNTDRDTGYLTDTYKFEGYAWFQRKLTITEDMLGKELILFLERTRMTAIYIDGTEIGRGISLSTPHRFLLPQLSEGVHTLTIRVNNTDYITKGGHLTSPDTQTNWNGITGRIELQVRPKLQLNDVMIFPDVAKNSIRVAYSASGSGKAFAYVEGYETSELEIKDGEGEFFYSPKEKMPFWDEYNTNVLTLVTIFGGEEQRFTFGMRKIESDGLKIRVNGNEVFLRGKHDGLVFPFTGYTPTSVSEWKRVFEKVKAYGINHYRFHTCCPPEAAFTAADEMGIYMQPELPFWGTVADEITEEQQFLIDEGFRMLKEFGNHPSFVMMTLGNELWGNKDIMNGILRDYKKLDNRHLYSDGSNNFQFWPDILEYADFFSGVRLSRERLIRGSYAMCDAPLGFIQTEEPKAGYNYDELIHPETVETSGKAGGKILIQYGTEVKEVEGDGGLGLIPDAPIITHEVGQYYSYPDYREIPRYTGSIKAENIAVYREKAEEKGLLSYAEKYHKASGRLAVECYKRECEAALLSKDIAGFQLLDIQDFPGQGTALVGVLNSLLEPKEFVAADEWRTFCNDTIAAAKMEKLVFSGADEVKFTPVVVTTNPKHKDIDKISYKVIDSLGKIIEENSVSLSAGDTGKKNRAFLTSESEIKLNIPVLGEPEKYRLVLEIKGTEIMNEYSFFVFPNIDVEITENGISYSGKHVSFVRSESEIPDGEKAVIIPSAEDKLEGTYCTDFWCYPMFSSISASMGRPLPTGTLGILADEKHPILKHFKSDFYTTPQWFAPIMHSHCESVMGTDIEPIVQMIDNPHRAEKFGIFYETETSTGKVLVSTVRLWEIADRNEARWLAKGILDYLSE